MTNPITRKIKAEIVLRGLTIPEIARCLGVGMPWVSQVINGHAKSARIRAGISRILDLPPSIWEEMDREQEKTA